MGGYIDETYNERGKMNILINCINAIMHIDKYLTKGLICIVIL